MMNARRKVKYDYYLMKKNAYVKARNTLKWPNTMHLHWVKCSYMSSSKNLPSCKSEGNGQAMSSDPRVAVRGHTPAQ